MIKGFDILLDASYQHVHGFAGRPCVVGREQQAVGFADAEQRTVGGEGFAREDVEGRAGDRTPVERFGQRRFIDDAAAGDVYEEAERFMTDNSGAPISPRVRSFSGAWIETMSERPSSSVSGSAG